MFDQCQYVNPFYNHSFVFEILHLSFQEIKKVKVIFKKRCLILPYHQIDSCQVYMNEDQDQIQDYVFGSLKDYLPKFDDY